MVKEKTNNLFLFFGHCVSQLSTAVQEEPDGGAGQRNTNEAYYSTTYYNAIFCKFCPKTI